MVQEVPAGEPGRKGEPVARRGQRSSGNQRSSSNRGGQRNRRARHLDNEGIIPVLAKAVREVEDEVKRRRISSMTRTTFQVVALLVRDERARIKADTEGSESHRAEQLKRLDGIATILAQTAAREPTLFTLLAEDAEISDAARELRREFQARAGHEPEPVDEDDDEEPGGLPERKVVPPSVVRRQLSNPFLRPDFSAVEENQPGGYRLAGWELIGPLLTSFERASSGARACMAMPEADELDMRLCDELMPHQSRVVLAAQRGHRTFLLADEPGLGKTAQALLAAEACDAFPLLVVVPNVVKTNWAREVELWLPHRTSTVVHGDGEDVDGFADVVVVNYDILDRHVGWLGAHGFGGMVVDEAHFIKNKSSQRSQFVLQLADRIRGRVARPLMMALTGTPLINDIEDFRAIWEFLGWIDEKRPTPALMRRLDETGLTPVDPQFYPRARNAVVDMGIVRRRKVDVASDIPARRIADLPVELDDAAGRSIMAAERDMVRRLIERYHRALAARAEARTPGSDGVPDGIDRELVRRVAAGELADSTEKTGENVFGMVRRIGQAKAGLAADYTAQLARNVGKVVFFAKHVDVMDAAQAFFTERGIRYASIRGDQTSQVRQANVDSFVEDPEVSIAVCSLMAAGVGINLQVASNVVLAELSWTDAEQTQAIDRVHRIGQDQPVTAWRIIAAQTLDARIAALIDSKAGLAARALDGSDEEVADSGDIQLEALVTMLTEALEAERAGA